MSEFSKMKYRVDNISMEKSVVMRYPDLQRYAHIFMDSTGLPDGISYEFVVRYIILMYSPNSPSFDIPDLNKRKAWAARYLNMEPDKDGKMQAGVSDVMNFRNTKVVEMTTTFLRLTRSEDWAIARACEQKQSDLLAKMLIASDDIQEELKLQQTIELNRKQLVETRFRLLEGEKSVELQQGVNAALMDENLGITPESAMVDWAEKGDVYKGIIP